MQILILEKEQKSNLIRKWFFSALLWVEFSPQVHIIPDDSVFFSVRGRFKESEHALCWLRGWVSPLQVQDEFQALCEAVQQPADDTDSQKEVLWRLYTKRTFYLPFILVSTAFFIGSFGGTSTLQTFAVVIFAKLKAPIDKYTAAVFLGVAQLVGTIICVIVIHFMGKRRLSFLSVIGTGLCFLITAVYGYLNDANYLDGVKYTWIPTSLMISAAFASHICIRTLPWILAGEVFPVKASLSITIQLEFVFARLWFFMMSFCFTFHFHLLF